MALIGENHPNWAIAYLGIMYRGAVVTPLDPALMDSPAGRATRAAARQHAWDAELIHPQMNFEIDLGLDSLARAECIARVEQSLGLEFKAEELSAAQTVGELVQLANARRSSGSRPLVAATAEFHWRSVLARTTEDLPEVEQLLGRRPGMELFAHLVLRFIHLGARLLFRMEVRGREVLAHLEPPYLICPNHQSYIDPLLVCSVYPRSVLRNIFHVGASMYFANVAMARLARLIRVVPIDPDVQLLRAMRAGAAGLRAGKILNIYPEGQRSFDGQLQEFKKGAAILATELNMPIVPVALDGAYRIWPRKSWHFRLAKVKIAFGEPINGGKIVSNETDEEIAYEKLTAELKQRIQQMLDDMRREE